MTRIRKVFLFGLGSLVAVALLSKLVLALLITPSFLEDFLEENLSCRVSLEDLRVSVWRREVHAEGLTLHPLEGDSEETAMEVGKLVLGVRLLPLFSRQLETTRFVIEEPVLRATFRENGEFSLAELFKMPSEIPEQSRENREEGRRQTVVGEKREKVLPAERNLWLAKLKEARLERGRLKLTFEKEEISLEVENLEIAVRDLRFHPEDLQSLNEVALMLAGNCRLYDRDDHLLLKMDLDGQAGGQLFEEASGELKPNLSADLALGEESYLNPRVQIVRKVWRFVDKVNRIGVPIGDLPSRIAFGRSRRIKVHYQEGLVRLQEPLSLQAGSWQLGLASDSWAETFSGEHEIGIEFLAGGKAAGLVDGLLDDLPDKARSLAQRRFLSGEQILWRVNSSGELSDPEFDFLSQLPEAKALWDQIEDDLDEEVDRVKEEAEHLFKGLFD
jgi:hypothetical protein